MSSEGSTAQPDEAEGGGHHAGVLLALGSAWYVFWTPEFPSPPPASAGRDTGRGHVPTCSPSGPAWQSLLPPQTPTGPQEGQAAGSNLTKLPPKPARVQGSPSRTLSPLQQEQEHPQPQPALPQSPPEPARWPQATAVWQGWKDSRDRAGQKERHPRPPSPPHAPATTPHLQDRGQLAPLLPGGRVQRGKAPPPPGS